MCPKVKLPPAKGPYSLWVKAGGYIYVSGQGPIDPESGEAFLGDIEEQTRITLNNVKAILEDAGATLADVIKTTVFLADIGDFARMNKVYGSFFGGVKPARSTVQAAALPLGIGVEIEAVAVDRGAVKEVVRS